jgi:four helix bundle protein
MDKHRDLAAWQVCRAMAVAIYRLTNEFPLDERFGLTAQLRRAGVSAAANIAEGNARRGAREMAHALDISLGSLAEIDTLLAIAGDLGYLRDVDATEVLALRLRASQLTYGLLRRLRPSNAVRRSVRPSVRRL